MGSSPIVGSSCRLVSGIGSNNPAYEPATVREKEWAVTQVAKGG
ncbi:MAG: hypothetical protein RBT01_12890 [Anaerolineaceae bacterium]|nr:hypothetical protein [Anaerolineaceae bacterium]